VVAVQDIPDSARINVVPQVCQGTLESSLAPGWVLLRHPDRQLLDLLQHTWSSMGPAVASAVKLLCNQPAIPTQQGIWDRKGGSSAFPQLRGSDVIVWLSIQRT
jgi:hypothetical protein